MSIFGDWFNLKDWLVGGINYSAALNQTMLLCRHRKHGYLRTKAVKGCWTLEQIRRLSVVKYD